MNPERDKFLCEVVLGECWHEMEHGYHPTLPRYECIHCHERISVIFHNPDFSTPAGFFKLWTKCKEKEWWYDFKNKYFYTSTVIQKLKITWLEFYINEDRDRFADAVYEFMKERK